MRPELLTDRDEQGNEYFYLPDASRPPAETPVPLISCQNLILSFWPMLIVHAFLSAGRGSVMILLDGLVAGTWRVEQQRQSTMLSFMPLAALNKST